MNSWYKNETNLFNGLEKYVYKANAGMILHENNVMANQALKVFTFALKWTTTMCMISKHRSQFSYSFRIQNIKKKKKKNL